MSESYPTNLAAVPVVSAGEKGYLVQLVSPEGDKVFPVVSANMIYDENGNAFSIPDTVNSVNNAINQVNTVLNNLNTTINNKFTQMNGTMDAATLQGHAYQDIIDAVPPYVHPTACQCNVTTELNNLKTSVANGKSTIASAISGKGVSTSSTATWATMASNINNIPTGIISRMSCKTVRTVQYYKDDSGTNKVIFDPKNYGGLNYVVFYTSKNDGSDERFHENRTIKFWSRERKALITINMYRHFSSDTFEFKISSSSGTSVSLGPFGEYGDTMLINTDTGEVTLDNAYYDGTLYMCTG